MVSSPLPPWLDPPGVDESIGCVRAGALGAYIELVLRYASYPSASVAVMPLRSLHRLLRNEAVRGRPPFAAALDKLASLPLRKMPRVYEPPFLSDSAGGAAVHVCGQFSEADFDDEDGFRDFYGQFRAASMQLIQELTKKHPLKMLELSSHVAQALAAGGAAACLDMESVPPPIAQEAGLSFIEQVMNTLPKKTFLPSSAANGCAQAALPVLRTLLGYDAQHSIAVLDKHLHCLARFAPFLSYHHEHIQDTMDVLLSKAAFRTAEDADVPPDQLHRLSKTTVQLRMRACVSMTRLCKLIDPSTVDREAHVPPDRRAPLPGGAEASQGLLDVALPHAIQRYTELSPQLLPDNEVLLAEALICLSNNYPTTAQRSGFIRQLLASKLELWGAQLPRDLGLFTDAARFRALLRLDECNSAGQEPVAGAALEAALLALEEHPRDLKRTLYALVCACKRCRVVGPEEPHPFADALKSVLPAVCSLLGAIESLWTQPPDGAQGLEHLQPGVWEISQNEQLVNRGPAAAAAVAASAWKGSTDPQAELGEPGVGPKHTAFLHMWLKEVREHCYELCGAAFAAEQRQSAEVVAEVAQQVFGSLATTASRVQNRHLLSLLRFVVEPMFGGGALHPHFGAHIGPPCLQLFFGVVLQRLQEGWGLLRAADTEEDDPRVLFEHTIIRNLGSRSIACLYGCQPSGDPAPSSTAAQALGPTLCSVLVEDPRTAPVLLPLLAGALGCPDGGAAWKAAKLLQRALPHLCAAPQTQQFVDETLVPSIVQTLVQGPDDGSANELLNLLYELYRQRTEPVLACLRSLPGVVDGAHTIPAFGTRQPDRACGAVRVWQRR